MKAGIWLYFFLLIFEGALRKWILPGLATPLLIIRDPLAFWLIASAWKNRLITPNIYLRSIVIIGIASTFCALFIGHGNLAVALFGARVFLLHLPLVFVIGNTFDKKDVEQLGKVAVFLAIPMTFLIAAQFYSPQSAYVNRGVGGDVEGAGFGGALGYFRPPGTFSFTNGNTLFYSLVGCFVFYFWLTPGVINRFVLLCASVALLAAVPLSISRTLFFQTIVSSIFAAIAISKKPKGFTALIGTSLVLGLGILILSKTSFYQISTEAFSARYDDANRVEGGLKGVLGDRFLGTLISAVTQAFDQPLFGYGLGISSNIGMMLLPGSKGAKVSDFEWQRLIAELGPLLGLATVAIRIWLTLKIATASYFQLKRLQILPWMLFSFGSLTLLQAQWAQPTSLGFCTLIGGLMVSSFRVQSEMSYK